MNVLISQYISPENEDMYRLMDILFLFPFDYFIIPIVKCIMFIIRTLTMLFVSATSTGVKNWCQ